jgi:hypothetical protein
VRCAGGVWPREGGRSARWARDVRDFNGLGVSESRSAFTHMQIGGCEDDVGEVVLLCDDVHRPAHKDL